MRPNSGPFNSGALNLTMIWPDLAHRTRRLKRVDLERLHRENPATLAVLLASSAEVLVLRRELDKARADVAQLVDVADAHQLVLAGLDARLFVLAHGHPR